MTPPTKSGLQVLEEIRGRAEKLKCLQQTLPKGNNTDWAAVSAYNYFMYLGDGLKLASDIEKLLAANEVMREALENTIECLCDHPNIRLRTNHKLARDWCERCHSWIYQGKEDKNEIKEALAAADKLIAGKD